MTIISACSSEPAQEQTAETFRVVAAEPAGIRRKITDLYQLVLQMLEKLGSFRFWQQRGCLQWLQKQAWCPYQRAEDTWVSMPQDARPATEADQKVAKAQTRIFKWDSDTNFTSAFLLTRLEAVTWLSARWILKLPYCIIALTVAMPQIEALYAFVKHKSYPCIVHVTWDVMAHWRYVKRCGSWTLYHVFTWMRSPKWSITV